MNVLHISPRLRPGSINQLAADVAVGMQQLGFRNVVMSPPNELVGRMTAASVQHQSSRGISVFTYFSELKRLRRVIRSSQAHVILTYTTQAACLAWRVCMEMPAEERPRIIGIHTTFPKHMGWTAALNCCDALIAISRHLRDELVRRAQLSDERNIWVIPYGVNEELCHPDYTPSEAWMEQWKRNRKHDDDTLSICIPGAITPLHGLDALPVLLARLDQAKVPVHLYIAGDTARAHQSYLKKLRKAFTDTKTAGKVSWLGARADLRDVIKACDVVLSLSRMPASHDRCILEALALGCPVAGYDHGAVGEMLDVFLAEGRVAPGDVAGIADRLEQWKAYRPQMPESLPAPYRLADTIRSIAELCTAVSEGRTS